MMYDRLSAEYGKAEREQNTIATLLDSLNQVRSKHEKILDGIRLHHSSWAQLTGNAQPLSLEEIQSRVLPPNTSLVEYFVGSEMVAVWVIRKESFDHEVIEIKRDELTEIVERLRQPFKDLKEGKIRNLANVSFNLKAAQKLYERLFLPIEKYLHKDDQLIIVPDGVLHYLPFEALVTERERKHYDAETLFSQYENANYLVEKYPISYIPAISILGLEARIHERRDGQKGQLLAFGSPDFGPFTDITPRRENQYPTKIVAVYKSSKGLAFSVLDSRDAVEVSEILQPSKLFLGEEATEDHFKQEAGNFPNIYLSTHAIVTETQPMYSLIAFAQDADPAEDGFLHTYEVFNLELDADLVTLSACETGLGKLHRGESIIGLTRAFLYAGASAVVVSLWSVEESSALLMKEFYRNVKRGTPKARALQQAKVNMLRTRRNRLSFSHPFLWAPFVLIGDWK